MGDTTIERPVTAADFTPAAGSMQLPERRAADRPKARHREPGAPCEVKWPEGSVYLR